MTKTKRAVPELRSLAINGRLWFDKSGGNTYHSVSISANGKWLFDIGMTYGYGSQFLYTALEALKKWGLISEDIGGLSELRETVDLYTTFSHTLKKELYKDTFKGQKTEDYYHQLVRIEALKNGEF
jgi:hypothetical protein